ncbi:toll-like receptor 2 [Periplaneta americana]|uniref:toll-like receptor 2 n=1 Tax=Periplaneta americana TaxID=6978 RepID=UPI0037E77771
MVTLSSVLSCVFLVIHYSAANNNYKNITFQETKEFKISEITSSNMSHQVSIQQVISMPIEKYDMCFQREYTAKIDDNSVATHYNNTLQLQIKMINMSVEKIPCNSNSMITAPSPPLFIAEKLLKLSIEANLNENITAGFLILDFMCWKRNKSSFRDCGVSLLLHKNLINHTAGVLYMDAWILEPVRAFKGHTRRLHIHCNPFLQLGVFKTLIGECCYEEMLLRGTGSGNTVIQNKPMLKSLHIIHALKNTTKVNFANLTQLTSLALPDTSLTQLSEDMKMLKQLTFLDVSINNLTNLSIDILASMDLRVLNVSSNNLRSLPSDFSRLKHIRILDISKNAISSGDIYSISFLNNLEELVLSNNNIDNIPKEMSSLSKLKLLDLSYNRLNTFHYLEGIEPYTSLEILKLSYTAYVMRDEDILEKVMTEKDILEKVNSLKYIDLSGNTKFMWAQEPFRFLRNKHDLELLNMSGIDMSVQGGLNISFRNEVQYLKNFSKLKVVDLSKCKISFLDPIIFTKFQNLEELYLSTNNLKTIPSNLIESANYIKKLDLSHNLLSFVHLNVTQNCEIKLLDISHNNITSPKNITSSGRIVWLDLSSNNIFQWNDPKIFSVPTVIQNVNLSSNRVNILTEHMRKSLEVLNSADLGRNPVDCEKCELKPVQNWLLNGARNKIHNYTCHWPMEDEGKNVINVKVECLPGRNGVHYSIQIIIVIIAVVALLSTGIIVYCYRLQIMYTIHMLSVRWNSKRNCDSSVVKEYDAFVCYSGSDSSWVCNELCPQLEREPENYKLCIHERDFPVGTFIIRNIDKAIRSSRHTIIILTNKFLTSSWCRWELELTNYAMLEEDRDILIMIQLEQLDQDKIPNYLQFLMRTRTYLLWPYTNPNNQTSRNLAWKRLRSALGVSLSQKNADIITSPDIY